jgi:hypothetical protein
MYIFIAHYIIQPLPMQQISAVKVAMKDRPKVFQFITLGLLSFSLLTIIVCLFTRFQEEKKVHTKSHSETVLQQPANSGATFVNH